MYDDRIYNSASNALTDVICNPESSRHVIDENSLAFATALEQIRSMFGSFEIKSIGILQQILLISLPFSKHHEDWILNSPKTIPETWVPFIVLSLLFSTALVQTVVGFNTVLFPVRLEDYGYSKSLIGIILLMVTLWVIYFCWHIWIQLWIVALHLWRNHCMAWHSMARHGIA